MLFDLLLSSSVVSSWESCRRLNVVAAERATAKRKRRAVKIGFIRLKRLNNAFH